MKNVEFKHINSNFQKKLKDERNFIQDQSKVIMAADKTTNHFLIDPKEYRKNVDKNVQKEFKKVTTKVVDDINLAHKAIVRDLEIEDRVFRTTERQAFITAKDHKADFQNAPKFRTINPMKGEIGRVSKRILTSILTKVRAETKLNQMENV